MHEKLENDLIRELLETITSYEEAMKESDFDHAYDLFHKIVEYKEVLVTIRVQRQIRRGIQ
jgi:hypothetical protein